jgi:hypothetical protein
MTAPLCAPRLGFSQHAAITFDVDLHLGLSSSVTTAAVAVHAAFLAAPPAREPEAAGEGATVPDTGESPYTTGRRCAAAPSRSASHSGAAAELDAKAEHTAREGATALKGDAVTPPRTS